MKYCSYWKEEVKKLPYDLQKECINYKNWKKINLIGPDIYEILDRSCSHIDIILKKNCIKSYNCLKLMCASYHYSIQKHDLLTFASINKMTLYKLSKRLEKKFGLNLLEWYYYNRTKYIFCGKGYLLKRLEIEIKGCDECPICLEKKERNIITNCGHIICESCIKYLYKVENLNGTIHNLISYSVYKNHFIPKCPICRGLMPIYLGPNQIIKCSKDCISN